MQFIASLDDDAIDRLMELRSGEKRFHQELLEWKKLCSGDRIIARYFGERAGVHLKRYRACCLILGRVLSEPPGDSKFNRIWPKELLDEVMFVYGVAINDITPLYLPSMTIAADLTQLRSSMQHG